MKPERFSLSFFYYVIFTFGLLGEVFWLIPSRFLALHNDVGATSLLLLTAHALIGGLLFLGLLSFGEVQVDSLVLRFGGFPVSRTIIADIQTLSIAFPFMIIVRDDGFRSKTLFYPVLSRRKRLRGLLLEKNPSIQII
jgi:hypothetical protein